MVNKPHILSFCGMLTVCGAGNADQAQCVTGGAEWAMGRTQEVHPTQTWGRHGGERKFTGDLKDKQKWAEYWGGR